MWFYIDNHSVLFVFFLNFLLHDLFFRNSYRFSGESINLHAFEIWDGTTFLDLHFAVHCEGNDKANKLHLQIENCSRATDAQNKKTKYQSRWSIEWSSFPSVASTDFCSAFQRLSRPYLIISFFFQWRPFNSASLCKHVIALITHGFLPETKSKTVKRKYFQVYSLFESKNSFTSTPHTDVIRHAARKLVPLPVAAVA